MKVMVFLTGATGFLGGQTARRLLAIEDLHLVVLVRGKDREEAAARLARGWWSWPELAGAIGSRVEVLAGDVTVERLGLSPEAYEDLVSRVTHVIHSAADLRLDGPLEELREINVQGTARVLDLARAAHHHHGLERFAHVSTAYVAGKRTGEVAEEALSDEHGFSNTYEQTKFEGEQLVRGAGAELPVSVFRPGMIVGDSRTGEIATFNTVYVPLRLYLTGKLKVMPCKGDLPVNVVPVDYVADAISRLTFDSRAEGKTFHLTMPPRLLPSARELLESVKEWAAKALNVNVPSPLMISIRAEALDGKLLRAIPRALISYFSEDRQFSTTNTESLLGPCTMDWKSVLPRLLAYAAARGFLHASGRTAHEQVVFRLQSRTRPVRFHEIADGRITPGAPRRCARTSCETVDSLKAMEVGRGDRVAIAGPQRRALPHPRRRDGPDGRGERAPVLHDARGRDGGDPPCRQGPAALHRRSRSHDRAGPDEDQDAGGFVLPGHGSSRAPHARSVLGRVPLPREREPARAGASQPVGCLDASLHIRDHRADPRVLSSSTTRSDGWPRPWRLFSRGRRASITRRIFHSFP